MINFINIYRGVYWSIYFEIGFPEFYWARKPKVSCKQSVFVAVCPEVDAQRAFRLWCHTSPWFQLLVSKQEPDSRVHLFCFKSCLSTCSQWRLKMFQCHPVSICRVWQAGVYCRYCDVSDRPSPDEAQCCPRLDVPNPVIWLKDPVGDDKFPSTSMMYVGLAIQPASNMSMSMVFTLYRGPVTNIVVLNTPTMDVGDLLPTAVVPWMRLVT